MEEHNSQRQEGKTLLWLAGELINEFSLTSMTPYYLVETYLSNIREDLGSRIICSRGGTARYSDNSISEIRVIFLERYAPLVGKNKGAKSPKK
jgi:hypothetical protein